MNKNGIENEEINKLLFVDADYEHNDKKYGGYQNTENALDIIGKYKIIGI